MTLVTYQQISSNRVGVLHKTDACVGQVKRISRPEECLPQRDLNGLALPVDAQADQLVAIDAALRTLSLLDERLVSVDELRFYAGLEVAAIAKLLGVSELIVKRLRKRCLPRSYLIYP